MVEVAVNNVSKAYGKKANLIQAVDDVSFVIPSATTLAVIGESGSGKSTLGRIVLGAEDADTGDVLRNGLRVSRTGKAEAARNEASIVLQEPSLALNPRLTVGESVIEPLIIHNRELSRKSMIQLGHEAFDRVHLSRSLWGRYPSQLSGGQQQRVGIARAIVAGPQFLVLDEPTASLDLSVRGRVLDTLRQLQEELQLTYMLITHDMATVSALADEVVVIKAGKVVEHGAWSQIRKAPQEQYTKQLLSSVLTVGY